MASKSEVGFGARLANAEKMATQLTASRSYLPPAADLDPVAFAALVGSIRQANTNVAALKVGYSSAVDARQRAFRKDADSVYKMLVPIMAGVRAGYGKDSKEVADIRGMITKIRGVKLKKATKTAEEKQISQSEASYGSVAKAFADIVTTLQSYQHYNPANTRIATAALTTKLAALTTLSNEVTTAYNKLKPARDERAESYKMLTARMNRVKDAIISQYGNKSAEYSMVKSLKA